MKETNLVVVDKEWRQESFITDNEIYLNRAYRESQRSLKRRMGHITADEFWRRVRKGRFYGIWGAWLKERMK